LLGLQREEKAIEAFKAQAVPLLLQEVEV